MEHIDRMQKALSSGPKTPTKSLDVCMENHLITAITETEMEKVSVLLLARPEIMKNGTLP